MNLREIPPETSSWEELQQDLDRAIAALSDDEMNEVLGVTNVVDSPIGIVKVEEYLRDNFDRLSINQRNYSLISLRIKNLNLQKRK